MYLFTVKKNTHTAKGWKFSTPPESNIFVRSFLMKHFGCFFPLSLHLIRWNQLLMDIWWWQNEELEINNLLACPRFKINERVSLVPFTLTIFFPDTRKKLLFVVKKNKNLAKFLSESISFSERETDRLTNWRGGKLSIDDCFELNVDVDGPFLGPLGQIFTEEWFLSMVGVFWWCVFQVSFQMCLWETFRFFLNLMLIHDSKNLIKCK